MSAHQQIADRLAKIAVYACPLPEDLKITVDEVEQHVANDLLDFGLREAVVRIESARENLMHLSGEAAEARRHIFLALAALKGERSPIVA